MQVKCWQIRRLMKAPQAAGTIHTDFERGFICAEVILSLLFPCSLPFSGFRKLDPKHFSLFLTWLDGAGCCFTPINKLNVLIRNSWAISKLLFQESLFSFVKKCLFLKTLITLNCICRLLGIGLAPKNWGILLIGAEIFYCAGPMILISKKLYPFHLWVL